MPKTSAGTRTKLDIYVRTFGSEQLSTDGAVLFCKVCEKPVSAEKKFLVTQHLDSVKHKALLAKTKESTASSSSVQQLLKPFLATSGKQSQFGLDLCNTFVAAGIPLHKLQNEDVRRFFEKYTKNELPSSSTVRKNLHVVYEKKIEDIRKSVGDKNIWVSADETTDVTGRYVAHVVIGTLHASEESQLVLVHAENLEKTNSSTISQLFTNAMSLLWPQGVKHERVLLFVTDAAAYMRKAATALKVLFPNMLHLTCAAHAVHRVAEEVRNLFPEVDKLVSNAKKVFLKAASRVTILRQIAPDMPLPPQPILTRWGTWITAALYYSQHFDKFSEVIDALDEDDADSIRITKELLKKPALKNDLVFISANFSHLPDGITSLENNNVLLWDSIGTFRGIIKKLDATPGAKGNKICEKCKLVMDRNNDLERLSKIVDALRGDGESENAEAYSPSQIACFKYAPITSAQVERTFSALKHLLSDRRQCLTFENLKMMLVIACNK